MSKIAPIRKSELSGLATLSSDRKFGTDGIKMSAGVISDPCQDQYARVCPSAGGGGSGSCGNPIIGD